MVESLPLYIQHAHSKANENTIPQVITQMGKRFYKYVFYFHLSFEPFKALIYLSSYVQVKQLVFSVGWKRHAEISKTGNVDNYESLWSSPGDILC